MLPLWRGGGLGAHPLGLGVKRGGFKKPARGGGPGGPPNRRGKIGFTA